MPRAGAALLALALLLLAPRPSSAAHYTLVGWNNLGMHCMDGDYSVFSLLPPYNTILAQLIDDRGKLVADPQARGITVTYEAVADPDGSINTTAADKTNFWDFVDDLFGVSLSVDQGLAGSPMPGPANTPRTMRFDAASSWFIAEGVPITPYDDAGHKSTYPMMRLVARDAARRVLASTDVVLPVSDEMDCRSCHASGAGEAAHPASGWALDPSPERDVRLNVLRLHDEKQAGDALFAAALADAGYDPAGLLATVESQRKSILCASCHLSEALPGSGVDGVSPLTRALHGRHAQVLDPTSGVSLDDQENRSACYRCHPGSTTRCLRGAMGAAVAADGTLAMQCQSCHGSMSQVAATDRTGWLDEPTCQGCHSGTATHNAGQIRFRSVFDVTGEPRPVVDQTFATEADTPAAGLSLYRFSSGHGGLQCAACHGSTHAELPAAHRNDNLQSIALQGHAGMLSECIACHPSTPSTVAGGPHGMHPVGQAWVERHGDAAEHGGLAGCRACHGADDRGTVLSRALADRTLRADDYGTKQVWRGFQIGCYGCHRGPRSEERNPNRPATAAAASASTSMGAAVAIPLVASDPERNALALRIVSQPAHGTVGLVSTTATYFPEPGFTGTDGFTWAAWDGSIDSNLATVTITVSGGLPDLTVEWQRAPRLVCSGTPSACRLRGRLVVRNVGASAAAPSSLALYLAAAPRLDGSEPVLRRLAVRAIAPGQSRAKAVGIALASSEGVAGKYAIAVADVDQVVPEADESHDSAAAGPIDAPPVP